MMRSAHRTDTLAHRWTLRSRLFGALSVVILSAGCTAGQQSKPGATSRTEPAPVTASGVGLTYPRTAAVYLAQNTLPPLDELARYDVIVLDNDWANRLPRAFFDELRTMNPRMKLLAYVNVVDSMRQSGTYQYWRNAHRLWRISPSDPATNTFPDQWLARTADGTPVHEWEDRVMTNLTDRSPRVAGQLFVEYAVDWIVDTVWTAGIWDGIFLDVWGERIYTADSDHWDVDRDGIDETDAQIYGPRGPLDRGLTIGEKRLRAALPHAIIVANSDRTIRERLLDGRAFESFMDPVAGRDVDTDLRAYVTAAASADTRAPGLTMTIDKNPSGTSEAALRKSRFELCATLLQNGYWASAGPDYGTLAYYDFLDGGGRGRGYLGQPLVEDPTMSLLSAPNPAGTGSPAPGVFRRDFDHGIVVVNTSTVAVTIPLHGSFTPLRDQRDSEQADGGEVVSVTLGPLDAAILLR